MFSSGCCRSRFPALSDAGAERQDNYVGSFKDLPRGNPWQHVRDSCCSEVCINGGLNRKIIYKWVIFLGHLTQILIDSGQSFG